jgi:hypothetical protein
MVLKPAAQTPLSMHALAAILTEAGLPPGVLNIVTTSDAGGVMEPLIRDGRARKLSFTGSTPVGKLLLEQAADKVLRTSMLCWCSSPAHSAPQSSVCASPGRRARPHSGLLRERLARFVSWRGGIGPSGWSQDGRARARSVSGSAPRTVARAWCSCASGGGTIARGRSSTGGAMLAPPARWPR